MPARSSTIFPDLTPPPGWTGFNYPPQVRLVPPGTTLQTAKVTIIVSPIAPRVPPMPPPGELISAAIAAEGSRTLDIIEKKGPEPAPSDFGLEGIAFHVRATDRGGGQEQRRIYVVYFDERFMYGINYMAFGPDYDTHLETFWKVARSIRPFQGRVVPPTPPPGVDLD